MKYPSGTEFINKKHINYANRGMRLEEDINLTNEYYRRKDIAYIYKKPTPIKIIKVSYDSLKSGIIKEAYFEMPSTTDYNGIFKGRYVDFEAKETKNKTSFPLDNIHKHQIKHMMDVTRHDAICFLIVRFTSLNETFLLLSQDLELFLKKEKRNSIPLAYFKENGYLIEEKYEPRIDYIKVIEKIMEVYKNER
ncbi:MAG: Holliday junction resolvase RecU [Bacilli bacterium]